MTTHRYSARKAALFGTGALAAVLLSGCSIANAHRVDNSAAKAETALARGQVDKAIVLAEAAVQAQPRDAARRALLANAYLKAGRFDSSATTFDDAMELGDNSARTALSLSLALIGSGRNRDAVAVLEDWRDSIPPSDLGLAMALAGETGRGVAILSDGLRNGQATIKLRQNLAYAYALDGRWRDARIMASMDLPADQIDARLTAWAAQSRPEAGHQRVAAMLGVPVRGDSGQPSSLALSNTPSAEQLAAEAGASKSQTVAVAAVPAGASAVAGELPPVDGPVPPPVAVPVTVAAAPVTPPVAEVAAPRPQSSFATAFAQPAARSAAAPRVQVRAAVAMPSRAATAVSARPTPAARPTTAAGTHLVQLGSFLSPQGARRAWGIYAARNPELKSTRMTITQATVRGKQYWRVAAGGLDGNRASGLCSSVKGRGGACFAYATTTGARGVPAGVPQRDAGGPMRARRR